MESVRVFVVDAEGKPLLPTHPAKARKLLRLGKAQVHQMVPFAIQLGYCVAEPAGAFTAGIDDGAVTVGLALVDEQRREVVLAGDIRLRQDVPRLLERRRMYRCARRYRKLRYRARRFQRAKRAGWLAPTIRQKKDSVVRVLRDLKRLVNISKVVIEQGAFDTSSLAAGRQLQGEEYQIPRYEGREFRAKVLWRDKYTCQHCGITVGLQAHHILPRAAGGTDTPDNGMALCAECHTTLHVGDWTLSKIAKPFVYPAHLQLGKHYVRHALESLGLSVITCTGWMTAYWRQQLDLGKSHIHDAAAMVCRSYVPRWSGHAYFILPKRKKVWTNNPTKQADEKLGFRHWDLVKARHRTRGTVIGSVRSLKADAITLRTAWDDNFPVSYRQSKLLWRFNNIIYI